MPVPAEFVGQRRKRVVAATAEKKAAARLDAELAYERWVESRREEVLVSRYSDAELKSKLNEVVRERMRRDESFRRVPEKNRSGLARQILVKELSEELMLPGFEQWLVDYSQTNLF